MAGRTIGNPLSWSAQRLAGAGQSLEAAVDGIGREDAALPRPRYIGPEDLRIALRKGIEDFVALRSDVIVAVVLYPIIGFILAVWSLRAGQIHLLFPLLAGFPLVGPIAAVGLYEMSRRREAGEPADWRAALSEFNGRVMGPVLALGMLLVVIFLIWLYAAHLVWQATLGTRFYDSFAGFLTETLTTPEGLEMILIGSGIGLVFAAVVLCISMVSFPMLIDRRVGVMVALATSFGVARKNPGTTMLWGLIVALSLALAMAFFFVGLIVVLPVLGHATWHLYRRAVEFPRSAG